MKKFSEPQIDLYTLEGQDILTMSDVLPEDEFEE